MKTAISIPDAVFEAAEKMARRLSMSRSELYTKAVRAFLKAHRCDLVREQLDAVYGENPSELDPELREMQRASISKDVNSPKDAW